MDDLARYFIINRFLKYKERKDNGVLYNETDKTPESLIQYYYLINLESGRDVDFNHITYYFKKKIFV